MQGIVIDGWCIAPTLQQTGDTGTRDQRPGQRNVQRWQGDRPVIQNLHGRAALTKHDDRTEDRVNPAAEHQLLSLTSPRSASGGLLR